MLFKKLFQLLVVGGAVAGTTAGCQALAQGQQAPPKSAARDGGTGDGGSTKADPPAAASADAGSGGGVQGW